MKASWFKTHGYRSAQRSGVASLLFKPFADDARPPRWFPVMTGPPISPERLRRIVGRKVARL
jgi:hypothetical protein